MAEGDYDRLQQLQRQRILMGMGLPADVVQYMTTMPSYGEREVLGSDAYTYSREEAPPNYRWPYPYAGETQEGQAFVQPPNYLDLWNALSNKLLSEPMNFPRAEGQMGYSLSWDRMTPQQRQWWHQQLTAPKE